ncbi:coumarin 8-geranyltransferase 1b, chloroplastic-like isoform X2 [Macadamia integrifolia]|uniref:coumarin 8-geranyltransferase 1b, chloroplastic-like isoform X2 n=1 Tax=Macadamia integrifolia TaxID=60698 RepID=UPI001C5337B3|nr:coumarin 8-geranyltransferase 1b, chloroplastic-like isoform X2 [Macadamia integrifolia]
MEALLRPAFSTFSLLPKYPYDHERGKNLKRNSMCFSTERRMSNLQGINRKCNSKKRFELLALPNNQGNVEKLPNEKYILENELSLPKQEDHNYGSLLMKKLKAFYLFCRPYTLIGTVVGILSVSFLPLASIADLSPTFFMGLLKALVVGLLVHIYINGVNQLADVEIDKVNKEFLPLASGDFSNRDVLVMTVLAIILSIGLGFMFKSPALLCVVAVNFLFGTAYSVNLPFLRWKRHPALFIPAQVFWTGLGFQIPYFIHMQKYVLGRSTLMTNSSIFLTTIMCSYCIPAMILKDIPDTKGDRENGIVTVSTQFGEEKAFSIATKILIAVYGLAMVMGASSSLWFGKLIAVFGHLALALAVLYRSQFADPTNPSSAQSFYMFFWKLIATENLLVHFVR